MSASSRISSIAETELLQLLAQRAAIDAEDARGAALVTFGIVEHYAEQRLFNLAQHEVVQMRRTVTVQAREVVAERALGVPAQWQLAAVESGGGNTVASSTLLFCCHVEAPRKKSLVRPPMRPRPPIHRNVCPPARTA